MGHGPIQLGAGARRYPAPSREETQRELLALTTENAPEKDKSETQGVLPPFMTVKEHQLDIAAGTCVVSSVSSSA